MVGERITFGGVASGIDTNLIIDQLMQVARRPILIAENRRAQVEQKTQAFGQVTSGLSSLLTRLEALNTIDTYRNRATSVLAKDVDANKVTAVASAGAALGAYSVHVTQRATASITTSATAVGQAIDEGVPMDQAGFGSALQTGTFSINGTQFTIDAASARTVTSAASVGAGFDADVPLDQGGLDIPPVVGSFTINGATINYDPATDQISDVVSYINNSSAEVTASFDDATKTFTLTRSPWRTAVRWKSVGVSIRSAAPRRRWTSARTGRSRSRLRPTASLPPTRRTKRWPVAGTSVAARCGCTSPMTARDSPSHSPLLAPSRSSMRRVCEPWT